MSGCKVKLNRDSGKKTAASLDFPISFYCPTESLLMFFPEQAACVLLYIPNLVTLLHAIFNVLIIYFRVEPN